MLAYEFPYQAQGTYTLNKVRDPDGAQVSGGAGTITWYDDETDVALTGQSWPAAVTWNAAALRYESEILATVVTALGQLVRGEVVIDASNGKRYRDIVKARVKVPSSI
jgi:hypothetical protein